MELTVEEMKMVIVALEQQVAEGAAGEKEQVLAHRFRRERTRRMAKSNATYY